MKKFLTVGLSLLMAAVLLVGCSNNTSDNGKGSAFDSSKAINVISREDGSGTRGAFIELFGVEEKDSSGKKVDMTTEDATINNSTSVMMTTVAGDEYSIGYISLGSLNDTVKAVEIDGVAATAENIKNGSYKISRPFNIVTKDKQSDATKDFIKYIMSKDGQTVVGKAGYIPMDATESYTAGKVSGKVVVAGSSSVTPVMEKLKEAYAVVNPNVEIEIQQSDSSTGIQAAIDGVCDIGMASRGLKDSEKSAGIKPTEIALDGIAVIVNKLNPTNSLTKDQVAGIYKGEITTWSEVQ